LISRRSPVLSVETVGPARITVGKESAYALTVRNDAQVAADQVTVSVRLPQWAEVTRTDPSKGSIGPGNADPGAQNLQWRVGRLDAAGSEKLTLRIVPRESRPIDLAVAWDYNPAASQAKIVVQEPKLEMQLDGPREVLFGKAEVYRLELRNTGTAAAENLEVAMLPMGIGDNVPVTHNLGTLAAGEKKLIEVEMTGRQTGPLNVKVDVRGDGGVEAHLEETVVVVRPELRIEVAGPSVRYVDTQATWKMRVANTGTAPARNVEIVATLPHGAQYASSSRNGQIDEQGRKLIWRLESLVPDAEDGFTVTCDLREAGNNRLAVVAAAEGDVNAAAEAMTFVEALADLVLEVTDPAGPISVGTDVVYQMEVNNRGTKEAEDVKVFAYFSHGIEPVEADGAPNQILPGQVAFETIPSLGAGEKVKLTIKARAETPGNHVFRGEVQCATLGAPLVEQETTHFYGEIQASEPPAGRLPSPTRASAEPQPLRTAERPGQPTVASPPIQALNPTPAPGP
jgi:uncharacterized repeat protein (TIGR01451 family)